MTVDQLLSSISSYELSEWAVFLEMRKEAEEKAANG